MVMRQLQNEQGSISPVQMENAPYLHTHTEAHDSWSHHVCVSQKFVTSGYTTIFQYIYKAQFITYNKAF